MICLTFVRVVKIHRIETDDGHLAGNHLNRKVGTAMENLKIWEWDEVLPDSRRISISVASKLK